MQLDPSLQSKLASNQQIVKHVPDYVAKFVEFNGATGERFPFSSPKQSL